jgi:hypothetical protein
MEVNGFTAGSVPLGFAGAGVVVGVEMAFTS